MLPNKALFTAIIALFTLAVSAFARAEKIQVPETVMLKPGSFLYRKSGEFLKAGYPVNAPQIEVTFSRPIEMMKFQVGAGDYEKCVSEAACQDRVRQGYQNENMPVTGVSYLDATAYAKWLSMKTGAGWRLPTDEEWAFAAGSRYIDDIINVEFDRDDPAARWLAKYKKYADLETGADPLIKPAGSYGVNENGLYDMSGNIWEWTDSCYVRTSLNLEGIPIGTNDNCGVRVAAGQHRSYMSLFVQDAKGGGCSIGTPPDYLGFRLVKEEQPNLISRFLKSFGF